MAPKTKPLKKPAKYARLAPDTAASGPALAPITRLRVMSSSEWEEVVEEWADSLDKKYARVRRYAGAGDQGCDVVAFEHPTQDDPWDNYQCKHYDERLTPGDVWAEIGKVVYYTHIKAYSMPRAYWFVAPHGVGPKLSNLLRKPAALRAELINAWSQHCEKGITATKAIPLKGALKTHVMKMDFSIFKALSPLTLIKGHRATPFYAYRFGGGLPLRDDPPAPPTLIAANETNYVRALLDAYEEHLKASFADASCLTNAKLQEHLTRARREFYSAESLRAFSRDNVPRGTFDNLLDEMDHGIADVVAATHADGFARVLAAVQQAKALALTANALVTRTTATDRGGMCHQLANHLRVKWRG